MLRAESGTAGPLYGALLICKAHLQLGLLEGVAQPTLSRVTYCEQASAVAPHPTCACLCRCLSLLLGRVYVRDGKLGPGLHFHPGRRPKFIEPLPTRHKPSANNSPQALCALDLVPVDLAVAEASVPVDLAVCMCMHVRALLGVQAVVAAQQPKFEDLSAEEQAMAKKQQQDLQDMFKLLEGKSDAEAQAVVKAYVALLHSCHCQAVVKASAPALLPLPCSDCISHERTVPAVLCCR